MKIFLKEDYQKNFKTLTLFFLLNSLAFYGHNYENQKDLKIATSSSPDCRIVTKKPPFWITDHLANFHALIWSGFWIIPNIIFANSCKPLRNVAIIPVWSVPLNLKSVEKKEKNYKSLNILRTKSFSNEIKNIFHDFFLHQS